VHLCNGNCLLNRDEPSDPQDPCVISETYGVFVSPTGSDAPTCGTQLAPCQTLTFAMAMAAPSSKRVYACGNAGDYVENLVLTSFGANAYGGFDCTTTPSHWVYDASALATVTPTSGIALQMTDITSSFTDFAFVSPAATQPGGSSIAVYATEGTNILLERCTVIAGAGLPGINPAQPAPYSSSAPNGSSQPGSQTANPQCTISYGGTGAAAITGGAPGGGGGPGTFDGDTPSNCSEGDVDNTGAPGAPGAPGAGATTWATFSATWVPTPGPSGSPGDVGQGGGGGASLSSASSGAGGAAGGCGGSGGAGGGSSIAVLLYNSFAFDLESCTLVATTAGNGGSGAPGQTAQSGGSGGTAPGECSGGNGGNGGNGGSGGGGAGGLSVGVFWTLCGPTIDGVGVSWDATLPRVTVASTGGAGGPGGPGAGTGLAGVAAAVDFQL
jgi:hypothetical protein